MECLGVKACIFCVIPAASMNSSLSCEFVLPIAVSYTNIKEMRLVFRIGIFSSHHTRHANVKFKRILISLSNQSEIMLEKQYEISIFQSLISTNSSYVNIKKASNNVIHSGQQASCSQQLYGFLKGNTKATIKFKQDNYHEE